ncbi:D-alanyl-D-alanine carboxypeptidase family protein [Bacillus canaveralius]|uniref:D-alanyl-D-alanine carboxypeptidase family protein n=1 Tax=Bacillus canaveralius TaxID=1403243 RepID=UPI000F7805E5|nr:D-alanyl-D-alanine carboxypeptidase family protein [Bacillus canaveralius]RSK52027.1 D-alanyl-D-alanine carboxypeptidase [Bacillus canaveralius]
MHRKGKLTIISIIISILIFSVPQKLEASVSISARSAILIEQESGRVLYEKDAHTVRRIASITKIMTAILAIESGKMDEKVKVSNKAVRTDGSAIYLQPGEKIKLEDLVYGLMLRSGNDAAVAIAEHVGGSLDGFVFLMNEKAKEIGMTDTHFENPHGLDDHEKHYSTAYDMALLTRYAMMNDTYKEISATKVYRTPNPNERWDRVWRNKNRMLTQLYEYSTGGKTGYTKRAKRTLVSTAEKNDMNLIAVTLNASDDWNDHIQLFEMAFTDYTLVEILPEGYVEQITEPFYKGRTYLDHAFKYPVKEEEKKLFKVKYKIAKPHWDDEEVPDIVGKAVIYLDGKIIGSEPVFYEKNTKKKKGFFDLFKNIFQAIVGLKQHG